jgi:S1-C subfamily serine protease
MERLIVKWTCLAALAMMLLWAAAAPARANEIDERLYKQTMPAMAWIICPIDENQLASGSGALVEIEGQVYVLTACHVVDDRPKVYMLFPTRDESGHFISDPTYYAKNFKLLYVAGEVVYRDRVSDVALIRPSSVPSEVQPLKLATSGTQKGQTVHIVGNSMSYDRSLWRYRGGMVYDAGTQDVKYADRTVHAHVINVISYVDHGDSGGPVLNNNGEIVGIVSGGPKGLCYDILIDVSEVRSMVAASKAHSA